MLTIEKKQDGTQMEVSLSGRLDTMTAPQLKAELKDSIDGITELVFDMTELEYITSAGLRILMNAQEVMDNQGEMIIKGANADVMDVFEVTGFVDILTFG